MATSLIHSISAMSSWDSLTPKTHPTMASYHTTKVIAHKASYSKLRPQIRCHGNIPQHRWTPCNTWFPQPKRYLDQFSRFFAQMTAECLYTLHWDAPPPLKIAPPSGGSGLPSNTWFLGPTRVLNPNGISIGAAVFAGLTSVTDRQTTLLGR